MNTIKFTDLDDLPIRLAEVVLEFAPGIKNTDQDRLKQYFAPDIVDWLGIKIREALSDLEADPELNVCFRLEAGGATTNKKTGQTIRILYSLLVRRWPYLTEPLLFFGSLDQVNQTFTILKRSFQHESAKAHAVDN
jgi:hypothetical protein